MRRSSECALSIPAAALSVAERVRGCGWMDSCCRVFPAPDLPDPKVAYVISQKSACDTSLACRSLDLITVRVRPLREPLRTALRQYHGNTMFITEYFTAFSISIGLNSSLNT